MLAKRWLSPRSLRGRLSVTALAGLTTTVVLTALLLLTALSAAQVVTTAQRTHEQVRVYTQLQQAARDYRTSAYALVNEPSPMAERRIVQTRAQFEAVLTEASQLPAIDDRAKLANARIARHGRVLIEHFRNPADLAARVARVDQIYRTEGALAAREEVRRITQPLSTLSQTLNDEIRRGHSEVALATRDAQSLIETAVYAAFGGMVLAILFSLAVQYLLQTRMRPALKRLEDGARAFGRGDLTHRVGLTGSDELARLGTAFDAMASTIAEKQQALGEIQQGLERAVADRTDELRRANAKLAENDERRREFLANVSHELRTPLTIIRGEAQVALRTVDETGFEPIEAFERILQQTQDLSRMVDDLLVIALAEAGHLPLQRETLNLRDIATRLVGDFDTLVSEMGGYISAAVGPEVLISGDEDRLRRAVAALIENSLRHSPRGVSIIVEAHNTADGPALVVRDDGPGLDFSRAHALFERFHRGEARGKGSGLGLSLVQALIQAHGGRAELAPNAGGGTVVTLHFPRHAANRLAA